MSNHTFNRSQTAHAVIIMQAWLDGKIIQFRAKDDDQVWFNVTASDIVNWDFGTYDFRIKPKPNIKRLRLCLNTIEGYHHFTPGQDGHQAIVELRELVNFVAEEYGDAT